MLVKLEGVFWGGGRIKRVWMGKEEGVDGI